MALRSLHPCPSSYYWSPSFVFLIWLSLWWKRLKNRFDAKLPDIPGIPRRWRGNLKGPMDDLQGHAFVMACGEVRGQKCVYIMDSLNLNTSSNFAHRHLS